MTGDLMEQVELYDPQRRVYTTAWVSLAAIEKLRDWRTALLELKGKAGLWLIVGRGAIQPRASLRTDWPVGGLA